jgi:hypothetical protein
MGQLTYQKINKFAAVKADEMKFCHHNGMSITFI